MAAILETASLAVGLGAVVGVAYLRVVRPWQLRWGATEEEVARALPGDELVAAPTFDATRAITIEARPEDIWPWLVQAGRGQFLHTLTPAPGAAQKWWDRQASSGRARNRARAAANSAAQGQRAGKWRVGRSRVSDRGPGLACPSPSRRGMSGRSN